MRWARTASQNAHAATHRPTTERRLYIEWVENAMTYDKCYPLAGWNDVENVLIQTSWFGSTSPPLRCCSPRPRNSEWMVLAIIGVAAGNRNVERDGLKEGSNLALAPQQMHVSIIHYFLNRTASAIERNVRVPSRRLQFIPRMATI